MRRRGSSRLFGALLILLPRDVRERVGSGMIAVFEERLQEASRSGAMAAARAWVRELAGLVAMAVRSRRQDEWGARADAVLGSERVVVGRHRAGWGSSFHTVCQDVRFALRSALRRPLPYTLAVVTCALGIGTSAAMFGVVDGVLWQALPYPDSERVISVYPTIPAWREHPTLSADWQRGSWSYPEYSDWQALQTSFQQASVFGRGVYTLTGLGEPQRLEVGRSSADLFEMLGASPIMGRGYTDDEGEISAERVLVLTHTFWQQRMGGSSDVLGRTLSLNGHPFTIIGVLPASFRLTDEAAQVWAPIRGSELTSRDDHNLRMLAHLAPGVSLERAAAETTSILRALSAGHYIDHGAYLIPQLEDETRRVRGPLGILLAAAVLLLAVACVNVAAILLGVGIDRGQELAVRGAIGAGRGRLVRQLITESLGLGLAGGAMGVLLALVVTRALVLLAPSDVPRLNEVALDFRALGFAALATGLVSVLFGLVPALTLTGRDLANRMRGSRVTGRSRRLHGALVIAQLALATVLVIGAGLLTRTLLKLDAVDPGFDARGVLTVRISPSARGFWQDNAFSPVLRDAYYERIRDQLSSMPDVAELGLTSTLPFSGDRANNPIEPAGYVAAPGEVLMAERNRVSAGYMDLMRMRVIEGRGFVDADERMGAQVAIVTQNLARRYWPDGSAIGRTFSFSEGTFTIVGVIDDVRDRSLAVAEEMRFYIAHRTGTGGSFVLRTRAGVEPESIVNDIRQRIWSVDPDVPITSTTLLTDRLADSLAQQRYRARLAAVFAAIAALFAVLGIYGVTSRLVASRTREIGVRAALGAGQASIARHVISQGVRLAAAGVLLGLLGGLAASRLLSALLYDTASADPLTFLLVPVGFTGLAALASLVPSVRAARLDPISALRSD